jgi:hypothetical protein
MTIDDIIDRASPPALLPAAGGVWVVRWYGGVLRIAVRIAVLRPVARL